MGGNKSRPQLQHSQQASVNYHVFPGSGHAPQLPPQIPYQMPQMGMGGQMPYQAGFPGQFQNVYGGGMPFQGGYPASPYGGYL